LLKILKKISRKVPAISEKFDSVEL